MRNDVVWAIRDARGLSTSEKAFLFVVESRGTAKTYRKTLMNDTAASDGQITNLVKSLKAKKCIVAGKDGRRTTYTVSLEGVSRLVPHRGDTHSVSDSAQPVSHITHSVSVEDSLSEDNKKNKKNKVKEKMKKNKTAPVVADAPTVTVESTSSLQREDWETFSCHSEPRMGIILESGNGGLLFEVRTADGFAYMLHESGVTGPLSLPETHTAAPVGDLDPIPREPATPSPLELELAEHKRKWATMKRNEATSTWDYTKRMHEEEKAIHERHGTPADAWW